ncbi:MAG: type II secretion system protein [bacterium]
MTNKFKRPKARARSSSGFTLVEMMVASVILVIFCVAFLSSSIASIRSQQLACDYYKAMTIARNRIQRATEFEYASILLMNENQIAVDGEGNIDAAGIYRRTTLVSAYNNGTTNLLQITVQVNYPAGVLRNLSDKPAELSTLITANM